MQVDISIPISQLIDTSTIINSGLKQTDQVHNIFPTIITKYVDNVRNSPRYVSYERHRDLIFNDDKILLNKDSDLLTSIKITDNTWCYLAEDIEQKSKFHMILDEYLSNKFNSKMSPLVSIIISYIDFVTTPYLQMIYNWNNKLPIYCLDLILEYSYGIEITRMIKSTPLSLIPLNEGQELKPCLDSNGYFIKLHNLSAEDCFPIQNLVYCEMKIDPFVYIEEYNIYKKLNLDIFTSYKIVHTNAFILSNEHRQFVMRSITKVPSLHGTCMGGTWNPYVFNLVSHKYEKPYESPSTTVNISDIPCRICKRQCFSCIRCKKRDYLFCSEHSHFVNKFENIYYCYVCKPKPITIEYIPTDYLVNPMNLYLEEDN